MIDTPPPPVESLRDDTDQWNLHARQWANLGPPLRPSPEDLAAVVTEVDAWLRMRNRTDATGLVLGVTPELCQLPVEGIQRIVAVDNSPAMIAAVWPGPVRPGDTALCADWREMPLSAGSVDLALADGNLTTLRFPSGYLQVLTELKRLLRPGGRCIFRCFAQREPRETPAEVFAALDRGDIGSFHALKWRLAMSLQPSPQQGVALNQVWESFNSHCQDWEQFATRFQWSKATLRTMAAYRGVYRTYSFPTLSEHLRLLSEAGFRVCKVWLPEYELSERCPTLVFERLDDE